jgi:hypothetical protein
MSAHGGGPHGAPCSARHAPALTPPAGRECLDVNARAGMIADLATIRELLYGVLPAVLRSAEPGSAVAALAQPWPTLEHPSGGAGLWAEK